MYTIATTFKATQILNAVASLSSTTRDITAHLTINQGILTEINPQSTKKHYHNH